MGEPRKAQSLIGRYELCHVLSIPTSITKRRILQDRHWIIEKVVDIKAVGLKNMSARRKRSKDHYPSQWPERERNEQYQCDCRYRENGEGMLRLVEERNHL